MTDMKPEHERIVQDLDAAVTRLNTVLREAFEIDDISIDLGHYGTFPLQYYYNVRQIIALSRPKKTWKRKFMFQIQPSAQDREDMKIEAPQVSWAQAEATSTEESNDESTTETTSPSDDPGVPDKS